MPTPAKTHGCLWNRLTTDDLPEIESLIEAEEYLGDATHHHDLRALSVALIETPDLVGNNGVVLRKPSGTLIAYGWVQVPARKSTDARLYLHGGCHPAWRHEGVQPTLVDWQVERATEWHLERPGQLDALELVMVTSAANHILAELLPARGFLPQRWYHALRCPLTEGLRCDLPGVGFTPFDASWSEPVRQLYNQTLSRASDSLDRTGWEWGLEASGIRDDLSWVALQGGRPVGWALNGVMDLAGARVGWTEYLGATPQWRNRGLYPALLGRSHDAFRAHGFELAGIGVEADSDQGARPYLELGYQSVDTMVWYVHRRSLDTIGAAQSDDADGT
ncbi:GNAT family N-acetyltransferase [Micropruina sp.]|uniref:GNAT family N-acetyltransferase n=1 Tax=Micropruina sp. TaxID=2737536 RepID=UPI0039E38F06